MINFRQGNLLEADVEAVVNTVNTVGVMGKGIALLFKERYPDNFTAYKAACKAGAIQISGVSEEQTTLVNTTASEQAALGKLLANWRALVPETLFAR